MIQLREREWYESRLRDNCLPNDVDMAMTIDRQRDEIDSLRELLRAAAPKCEWCRKSLATWYVQSRWDGPVEHWLCDEHRTVDCRALPLQEYDLGRRIWTMLEKEP